MTEPKATQLSIRMTRFPEGTVFELFMTAASQGRIETRRLASAELVTPPVARVAR